MATSEDFVNLFSMRGRGDPPWSPHPDFKALFPRPRGIKNRFERQRWFEEAEAFGGLTEGNYKDEQHQEQVEAIFVHFGLGVPTFYKTVLRQRTDPLTGEPKETVVALFPESALPERKNSEFSVLNLPHYVVANHQHDVLEEGLELEGPKHPILG